MTCPTCNTIQSGSFCKLCEGFISEPKIPVKKVKKVSDKRKLDQEIYKRLRSKFLRENPRCAVYPDKKATEVHHKRGRNGKNYLDVSTWLAVSQAGHEWIHSHDKEAREKGWLLTRTGKD